MASLKDFNTFGIDVNARVLHHITSVEDLKIFTFKKRDEFFILGGGSNMLLTKDVEIPVLKNGICGITTIESSEHQAVVKVGGGENWHQFVLWALSQNLGGIENLSLIPGTVGASPIQNIGAYGVEVADVISKVYAYDMLNQKEVSFRPGECNFAYRDSIFKSSEHKGQFFILYVEFKLHKAIHEVNLSYGPIKNVLQEKGISTPNIQDVSQAVIEIRQSKLPDPAVTGNSGSFFKNPIVLKKVQEKIDEDYDYVPFYPVGNDTHVKIPAGWLIEKCGWKGKRVGNTGNYKYQSLIIVNHGNATGAEIYDHAKNVRQSVKDKFGITLEFEVNII